MEDTKTERQLRYDLECDSLKTRDNLALSSSSSSTSSGIYPNSMIHKNNHHLHNSNTNAKKAKENSAEATNRTPKSFSFDESSEDDEDEEGKIDDKNENLYEHRCYRLDKCWYHEKWTHIAIQHSYIHHL